MSEERTVGAIAVAVVALVALVLSAGALITAANGTGGSAPALAVAAASSDAPIEVSVELTEFAITPSSIEIAASGSLLVTNGGVAQHDLAVVDTGLATPMLNAGESATLDLSSLEPGTYDILCTVAGHEAGGMKGTLTVVGTGTQPAAADAGDDANGGHGDHGADTDWAALDAAMHDTILEFPAATEGLGNQPLEPTILEDGTKRFELTAEIIDWEVAPGKVVEGWAYNGQIPGPMIQTQPGDKVEVVVTNKLPLGTDVHWHGLIVPNAQDGVSPLTQELIEPGESHTYAFTTEEAAVNMYHPHHHAQMKVPNGMWGVFLVGDLPMPEAGSVIGGKTLPEDMTVDQVVPMVVNDAGTIGMSLNGKSFPATAPIVAKKGDNILLHYYNEGYQIHPMHLHGMPQLVVAKDGYPLDQPYWSDTVNVAPGERFSVLIPAEHAGVWAFHCHILTHAESDEGMYGMVTALIVEE
ncbi:multicopper oxidase domain-containing protein [Egicoccus sp. AB-alg6-2]|uniref:multicopper oxidase domain-containing protein n=1 Tax=Egicoccus sp. AB-alg6-2 TaxID=3242692 RepID=UPI00359E0B27